MNESLLYGENKGDVSIEMGGSLYQSVRRRNGRFAGELDSAVNADVIRVHEGEDRTLVTLDTITAGAITNAGERWMRTQQMVSIINRLGQVSHAPHRDPALEITLSGARLPMESMLGMHARITKERSNEEDLSRLASLAMIHTAHNLRAKNCAVIDPSVHCVEDDQKGLELIANKPLGAILSGYSSEIGESQRMIEFSSDNLYSHEAQLICLSGLIAIARA